MIVKLKKDIKPRIANGHPWVYANEILDVEPEIQDGDIVDVFSGNNFKGRGYYNYNSLIRVRILTRKNEEINRAFFEKRINEAVKLRTDILGYEDSFRVIYGEGDGLPGLIVDKFSDYLVIQINTLGIWKQKETIIDILKNKFNPKAILEKDDEKNARKEGFEPVEGWIYNEGPEVIPFTMNGINFFCDTIGQKTGFFLDQRINAKNTAMYCKNKKVIDAFSYTGNFGVHALVEGAKFVTFIDYSPRALEILEKTLKANNIDPSRYEIINANTFDYLRILDDASKMYDVTIIDPPSLAKSRDSKDNALKGYKELNLRAMRITKQGGLISTSSCTQIVYDEDFKNMILDAAHDAKKKVTEIYRGYQAPDHPIVLNIFETEYLKHFLLRVDSLSN